jgi:metal-responsive CopG/Arc/MetJ family transcriptional regulator
MPASAKSAKRVVVDFPEQLLRDTDQTASLLDTNRSDFIREAVEEYVKALRRKRIEEELAAACEANDELERKICEDFSYVDAETC